VVAAAGVLRARADDRARGGGVTVTAAAALIIERRLRAPAMTSPTYSLSLVFGAS
jgi:hypothetical protein